MPADTQRRLTPLLANAALHRLERMRLCVSRRFTNRSRGEHFAGRGGSSNEFSDYRDYASGDDVRFVDWNIFSRLHRPYLKLYEHEEDMHIVLLVDNSASMDFGGKLALARTLAAAFGLIGLVNNEKVSVYPADAAPAARLAPGTGRGGMRKLFAYLETMPTGNTVTLERAIENLRRIHRGRGAVILLSDFLTPGELTRPLNLLYSAGLAVFGVQILSAAELDPELSGDIRFVDCETAETLDVSAAGDLLGLYHEYRQRYQQELALFCRQRAGRFTVADAAADPEWLLFDHFRRQGWIQ